MRRVYPKDEKSITGKKGLNLAEAHVLDLSPEELRQGKNLLFFRSGKKRRRGFRQYSTEDWSADSFQRGHQYLDSSNNPRLLVNMNSGDLKEILSASSSSDLVTGLGNARKGYFADAFGACFFCNGDDDLYRIDGKASGASASDIRLGGVPAPVASFGAAAGAAGVRSGDYAFMATAVIESAGVRLLESNWSDQIEVTLASEKVDFTWTNPAVADSRVTHVYIYGTRNNGATYFFIRKVALAATGYTGDDTADADLGSESPLLNRNVAPPASPQFVLFSGGRLVLIKDRTVHFSNPGKNSYDVESFPFSVDVPGRGVIKAAIGIGNPGGVYGTNSLMVLQDDSIHIFFQTDPRQPVQSLSWDTGGMNYDSVVQRGKYIFFVDRRKGVMFWPGEGLDLHQVSEKINTVFHGGGHQSLTANQSDADVQLKTWRDMLLLTVRDDSAKSHPNKVYAMNLLRFEELWQFKGAQNASEWIGPWQGEDDGIGFNLFIPGYDRNLYLLDNENKYISRYNDSSFYDYIDGADSLVRYSIKPGPALAENKLVNKSLRQFFLYAYNNKATRLSVYGELDKFILPNVTLTPRNYGIPVEDIPLIDIVTLSETWLSETDLENGYWASWFLFDIDNVDVAEDENDFVWLGYQTSFVTRKRKRTWI